MSDLKIDYPCFWEYKIIGADFELLQEAVAKLVSKRTYELSLPRKSKNKRYIAFDLRLKVWDNADRDKIFAALSSHPAIKLVI